MSSDWEATLPAGGWIRYRNGELSSADEYSALLVLATMEADGFVLLGHTGPTVPADESNPIVVAAAVLSIFPGTVGLPDVSSLTEPPVRGVVY